MAPKATGRLCRHNSIVSAGVTFTAHLITPPLRGSDSQAFCLSSRNSSTWSASSMVASARPRWTRSETSVHSVENVLSRNWISSGLNWNVSWKAAHPGSDEIEAAGTVTVMISSPCAMNRKDREGAPVRSTSSSMDPLTPAPSASSGL